MKSDKLEYNIFNNVCDLNIFPFINNIFFIEIDYLFYIIELFYCFNQVKLPNIEIKSIKIIISNQAKRFNNELNQ